MSEQPCVDLWFLENINCESIGESSAFLNDAELRRADEYQLEAHRCRYIQVRSVLKTLLGRYTGRVPADVNIQYASHGKPFIDGAIEFNVSYSQDRAVIGLTRTSMALGVDIERLRNIDEEGGIVSSWFAESEQRAYFCLPREQRNRAFFKLWTRKEAYLKALGSGLHIPLDRFSIHDNGRIDAASGRGEHPQRDWVFRDISPAGGYQAALVCNCPEVEINRFSYRKSQQAEL